MESHSVPALHKASLDLFYPLTYLLQHLLWPFSFLQSKPDSSELGSPKTTDDIVQEKGEEGRAARRRHKTENVKQQWSQERAMAVELEQAQRCYIMFHLHFFFFFK